MTTISGKNGEFTLTASCDVDVSDGYHTMEELYEHRCVLWIALCRAQDTWGVWRSRAHADGSTFDGWFILGMDGAFGQMSYHLPESEWESCEFAETRERAPKWDGHTSQDVLTRLRRMWASKVPA